MPRPFSTPSVKAAFDAFPDRARPGLLQLRELILQVADETNGVGRVEEALRWGQPAYLTPETKAGSTIRLGIPKTGGFALFVTCSTSLIEDFRAIAGPGWRFDGSRAVLFDEPHDIDERPLSLLIRAALTYHQKAQDPAIISA